MTGLLQYKHLTLDKYAQRLYKPQISSIPRVQLNRHANARAFKEMLNTKERWVDLTEEPDSSKKKLNTCFCQRPVHPTKRFSSPEFG
jgi:hypothetical protein